MTVPRNILILLIIIIIFIGACVVSETLETPAEETKQPPLEIPEGILVNEIPQGADIIFTSVGYVLADTACLDADHELKENFILDLPDYYAFFTYTMFWGRKA